MTLNRTGREDGPDVETGRSPGSTVPSQRIATLSHRVLQLSQVPRPTIAHQHRLRIGREIFAEHAFRDPLPDATVPNPVIVTTGTPVTRSISPDRASLMIEGQQKAGLACTKSEMSGWASRMRKILRMLSKHSPSCSGRTPNSPSFSA